MQVARQTAQEGAHVRNEKDVRLIVMNRLGRHYYVSDIDGDEDPVNGCSSRECRDAVRDLPHRGSLEEKSRPAVAPGGQATQFDSYGDFDIVSRHPSDT